MAKNKNPHRPKTLTIYEVIDVDENTRQLFTNAREGLARYKALLNQGRHPLRVKLLPLVVTLTHRGLITALEYVHPDLCPKEPQVP